jgi:uncharacterized protein YkwD
MGAMKFLSTTLLAVAAILTATLAALSVLDLGSGAEFSTQPFHTGADEATSPSSTEPPDEAGVSEGGNSSVVVEGCGGVRVVLGAMEARLVELHNEERSVRDLPKLCVREELVASSRLHSEEMIERDYFAHETPEDENAFERMKRAGYTLDGYASISTGENLAWRTHRGAGPEPSDAKLVVEGWLESEGHRRNLLDPDFREVGVGTATGEYKDYEQPATMYTVNFGVRE